MMHHVVVVVVVVEGDGDDGVERREHGRVCVAARGAGNGAGNAMVHARSRPVCDARQDGRKVGSWFFSVAGLLEGARFYFFGACSRLVLLSRHVYFQKKGIRI